jgi:hypothetical protein
MKKEKKTKKQQKIETISKLLLDQNKNAKSENNKDENGNENEDEKATTDVSESVAYGVPTEEISGLQSSREESSKQTDDGGYEPLSGQFLIFCSSFI